MHSRTNRIRLFILLLVAYTSLILVNGGDTLPKFPILESHEEGVATDEFNKFFSHNGWNYMLNHDTYEAKIGKIEESDTLCRDASVLSEYKCYRNLGNKNMVGTARENQDDSSLLIPQSIISNGKCFLVTEISDYAFLRYNKLVSITIPDTIRLLGDFSLADCTNLKNIDYRGSKNALIGKYAYIGTIFHEKKLNKLNEMDVLERKELLESNGIIKCEISGDTLLVTGSGTIFSDNIKIFKNIASTVVIRGNIIICNDCFRDWEKLSEIRFYDEIICLGSGAFRNTKISSFTFPSLHFKVADRDLLSDCFYLTTVNFHGPIEKLEREIFKNCHLLKQINMILLNETRFSCDKETFGSINSNFTINIEFCGFSLLFNSRPESNPIIDTDNQLLDSFFTKFKDNYIINPHYFVSIRETKSNKFKNIKAALAFSYEKSTQKLVITGNGTILPATLQNYLSTSSIESNSILEIAATGNEIIQFGDKSVLGFTGLITISAEGTTNVAIDKYVFQNCTSLTYIKIPNIAWVQESAFDRTAVEDVSISKTKFLANYAFANCENLENVTLRGYLTLGQGVFHRCFNLKKVVYFDTVVPGPAYSSNRNFKIFTNSTDTNNPGYFGDEVDVYVPSNYQGSNFAEKADIEFISNVLISESLNYTYINNELFIDGNGTITNDDLIASAEEKCLSCGFSASGIKEVQIVGQTITISTKAFDGCSSLTFVEIFVDTPTIQSDAFYNCLKLTKLSYCSEVIQNNADVKIFTGPNNQDYSNNVAIYVVPSYSGKTFFGNQVSYDLTQDTTIGSFQYIFSNETVKIIALKSDTFTNYALIEQASTQLKCDCLKYNNFQNLYFGGAFTITIGKESFKGVNGVTSVQFEDQVTAVFDIACFQDCSSLEVIGTPPNVMKFEENSFESTAIQTITIPQTSFLDNYTFSQCEYLESVIMTGYTALGQGVFNKCFNLREIKYYSPRAPSTAYSNHRIYQIFTTSKDSQNPGYFGDNVNVHVPTDYIGDQFAEKLDIIRDVNSFLKNNNNFTYNEATLTVTGTDIILSADIDESLSVSLLKDRTEIVGIRLLMDNVQAEASAFKGCTNLKNIDINAKTSINLGENCFQNCEKIELVTLCTEIVPSNNDITVFTQQTIVIHGIASYQGTTFYLKDVDKSNSAQIITVNSINYIITKLENGLRFQVLSNISTNDDFCRKAYNNWNCRCEDFVIKEIIFGESAGDVDLSHLPNGGIYRQNHDIEAVIFNNKGLTTISTNTFQDCTSLKTLVLPEILNKIGVACFQSSNLVTLKLPGCDYVDNYAFNSSSKLESVEITGYLRFGNNVFDNCLALTSIKYYSEVAPISVYTSSKSFKLFTINGEGYYGDNITLSVLSYYNYNAFAEKNDIIRDINAYISDTINFTFIETKLYISGEGSVTAELLNESIESKCFNCSTGKDYITTLIIETFGNIIIKEKAFSDFIGLNNITIKSSNVIMEESAFHNCKAITTVVFCGYQTPENIKIFTSDDNTELSITVNVPASFTGDFYEITTLDKSANKFSNDDMDIYYSSNKIEMINKKDTGLASNMLNNLLKPEYIKTLCNCYPMQEIELYFGGTFKYTVNQGAFKGNNDIKTVIFSSNTGIPTIYSYTFQDCASLSKVVFPNKVNGIRQYAFSNTALSEVQIPDCDFVDNFCFASCQNLNKVEFATYLNFGSEVFKDCFALLTIVYCSTIRPKSAYNSQSYDFKIFTTSSQTISLVDNITIIVPYNYEETLFGESTKLSYTAGVVNPIDNITYNFQGEKLSVAGSGTFNQTDIATAIPEQSCISCKNINDIKIIEISGTVELEDDCFNGMQNIQQIIMFEGVAAAGVRAFANMKITDIILPDTINYLADELFLGCNLLERISIEGHVTIGAKIFSGCSSLKEINYCNAKPPIITDKSDLDIDKINIDVYVPSNYESDSFFNYSDLNYSANYFEIENLNFTILKNDMYIEGEGVTDQEKVDQAVFTTIHCLHCRGRDGVFTLNIGEKITIGEKAFINMTNLKEVKIPEGPTELGPFSFYGSGLLSINVPYSVRIIRESVFDSCFNIDNIYFQSKIDFGKNVFNNCSKLANIFYCDDSPPTTSLSVYSEVFGTSTTVGVHVPSSYTESLFLNKVPILNANIINKDKITFEIIQTKAIISGTGELTIEDLDEATANPKCVRCGNRENLVEVQIISEAISIGTSAFENCTKLTKIILDESLSVIGESAFENTGITSFELSKSVRVLNSSVFSNCLHLASFYFDGCVEFVDTTTFSGSPITTVIYCDAEVPENNNLKMFNDNVEVFVNSYYKGDSLASITSLTRTANINNDIIFNKTSLNLVGKKRYASNTIEEAISNIKCHECKSKYDIREVEISGESSIGDTTFFGLKNLISIKMNDGFTTAGVSAFSGTGIQNIDFPSSFHNFVEMMMKDCIYLKHVRILGGASFASDNIFSGCTTLVDICYCSHAPPLAPYGLGLGQNAKIFVPSNYVGNNFGGNQKIERNSNTMIIEFVNYTFLENELVVFGQGIITQQAVNTVLTSDEKCLNCIGKERIHKLTFNSRIRARYVPIMENDYVIDENAFKDFTNLVNVSMPMNGIQVIGKNAFKNTAIKNFVSVASVNTINESAFDNCTELETFNISSQIVLYDYVFNNCFNLKAVYYFSDEEPILKGKKESVFTIDYKGLNSNVKVYVGKEFNGTSFAGTTNISKTLDHNEDSNTGYTTPPKSKVPVIVGATIGAIVVVVIIIIVVIIVFRKKETDSSTSLTDQEEDMNETELEHVDLSVLNTTQADGGTLDNPIWTTKDTRDTMDFFKDEDFEEEEFKKLYD